MIIYPCHSLWLNMIRKEWHCLSLVTVFPCSHAIMCQNWVGIGSMLSASVQFQPSFGTLRHVISCLSVNNDYDHENIITQDLYIYIYICNILHNTASYGTGRQHEIFMATSSYLFLWNEVKTTLSNRFDVRWNLRKINSPDNVKEQKYEK